MFDWYKHNIIHVPWSLPKGRKKTRGQESYTSETKRTSSFPFPEAPRQWAALSLRRRWIASWVFRTPRAPCPRPSAWPSNTSLPKTAGKGWHCLAICPQKFGGSSDVYSNVRIHPDTKFNWIIPVEYWTHVWLDLPKLQQTITSWSTIIKFNSWLVSQKNLWDTITNHASPRHINKSPRGFLFPTYV